MTRLKDFVMWFGVGALLLCGMIVGKEHFNKVMREIFDKP